MKAAGFLASLDVLIDRALAAGIVDADEVAYLRQQATDLLTVYRLAIEERKRRTDEERGG